MKGIVVKKVRKLYVNEPDSPRTISACNKILAQWVAHKGVLSPGLSPVGTRILARDTSTRTIDSSRSQLANTNEPDAQTVWT